jgi:hypothetical protein
MLKQLLFLLLLFTFVFQLKAQNANCVFLPPAITVHFGAGNVPDINISSLSNYDRVGSSCPSDGHYTYTDYTSDCFRGDWLTLTEDHTPGDESGNMLLVNSSYTTGSFFSTTLNGLKTGTTYEFGVWMMNVCRISDKCPFPLLPDIVIRLQTPSGKTVAQFGTGEIARLREPHWTQYRALFTTGSETSLTLIMINNNPGGCGNDFALDDITLRECKKPTPVVKTTSKKTGATKKQTVTSKPPPKKSTSAPAKKQVATTQVQKPKKDPQQNPVSVLKPRQQIFPPAPPQLTSRTNSLVKRIETEAGEIRIDLYDNGEIDGDTVSIYHNNVLLMPHARLSQKPLTVRFAVDAGHPHHELIMVAENLGSIPPNTSLMIITAGTKRYQAFISSNEQKNAKVILDLKE